MFCALSQNYQHLLKHNIYAFYSKLSKSVKKQNKTKQNKKNPNKQTNKTKNPVLQVDRPAK